MKPIPGYPGYFAGINGGIYSSKALSRKKGELGPFSKRTLHINTTGRYLIFGGSIDGKLFTKTAHSLICMAYHGPRPDGNDVSHLNGDWKNNRPNNLAWETKKKNMSRRIEHGTDDAGHRHTRAKLTQAQVIEVRELLAGGASQKDIGDYFGVSQKTISRVNLGRTYFR